MNYSLWLGDDWVIICRPIHGPITDKTSWESYCQSRSPHRTTGTDIVLEKMNKRLISDWVVVRKYIQSYLEVRLGSSAQPGSGQNCLKTWFQKLFQMLLAIGPKLSHCFGLRWAMEIWIKFSVMVSTFWILTNWSSDWDSHYVSS